MLDIWYTFPATMGENQAWITYNHGYAEVAEADPRHNVVRIELQIKDPTGYGMPTNEEFPKLSAVDEALDDQFTSAGGVYVGRVTVAGRRFFYFYMDIAESKALEIIEGVSGAYEYELQYLYEPDEDRNYYWNELYPTADDWQVIQDLKVLDALADDGDIKSEAREVMHWAYFPDEPTCVDFSDWVKGEGYQVHYAGQEDDGSEYITKYSHIGTMELGDITSHTIRSNRKARELGGRYDGWETGVVRK